MGAMAGEYATLRWSAHEHEHVPRDSNWYWALGILAACVALISVLFGNVLFAILILVAAATLGILATTPPPLIEFELSDRGIRVGGTMHRYEEVISFWVEDHDADPPILLVDKVDVPESRDPARTCRPPARSRLPLGAHGRNTDERTRCAQNIGVLRIVNRRIPTPRER